MASGGEGTIRVEPGEAVTRIVLARPPLNILDIGALRALDAAIAEAGRRPALRVLVLAAEGKAFSAGVAVEDHLGDRADAMLDAFHGVFRRLHGLECATVAAVQGPALGGGAELATFCDLVVASERATIGQPEIRVGVFPPVAAIHYPARIGVARTLDLLLSGRTLAAREAERIGLVDRVVPPEELERAVDEAAAGFAGQSAAVLRLAKRAVRLARPDGFLAALDALEALYRRELMATADAAEGLAAFVARRAPVWAHR